MTLAGTRAQTARSPKHLTFRQSDFHISRASNNNSNIKKNEQFIMEYMAIPSLQPCYAIMHVTFKYFTISD